MGNMNFNEFVDYVKEHLFEHKPYYREACDITISHVAKNNGVTLTGLSIRETGFVLAPTIYMDGYFREYEEGRVIEAIMGEILFIFENSKNECDRDFDVDFINSFKNVEALIGARLINGPVNEARLGGMPHYKFGDLAVIFHIEMTLESHGPGLITVTNEMLKHWGIDASTLFETAQNNMLSNNPAVVKRIEAVMLEMIEATGRNPDISEEAMAFFKERAYNEDITSGMYVLSNKTASNGAIAMLQPGFIENISLKAGMDIFILPSSIHECILVPDDGSFDVQTLKKLINEVNTTQVPPEEVLSYNVYKFDYSSLQFLNAETYEPIVLEDVSKGFTVMFTPDQSEDECRA